MYLDYKEALLSLLKEVFKCSDQTLLEKGVQVLKELDDRKAALEFAKKVCDLSELVHDTPTGIVEIIRFYREVAEETVQPQ